VRARSLKVPTEKLLELVKDPTGVTTVMGPVETPAGTVAKIVDDPKTLKGTRLPLKRTEVAPSRWVPVIMILCPSRPKFGEKLVMVGEGAAVTVNTVALTAGPAGFSRVMSPVVAPAGTKAAIVAPKNPIVNSAF
jgi:hypothetical protein